MSNLIIIPARAGSKGVPMKNIKILNKKPLIMYTLDVARSLFDDDSIYVTTDDHELIQIIEEGGFRVPFIRPDYLASDSASMRDVIVHCIEHYKVENGYYPNSVILLQPTSPFRSTRHVLEALEMFDDNADLVVSVKETSSNPYYVLFEEDNEGYLKPSKVGDFVRRQDCPKVWEFNGAIYVIRVSRLLEKPMNQFDNIRKYEMDEISSHDIDTELDWIMAKHIAESIENKKLNK